MEPITPAQIASAIANVVDGEPVDVLDGTVEADAVGPRMHIVVDRRGVAFRFTAVITPATP